MNVALETDNLTRDFSSLRAVDQLSLRVPAGCFYGFLGPNGAGKSTTIKMLIVGDDSAARQKLSWLEP